MFSFTVVMLVVVAVVGLAVKLVVDVNYRATKVDYRRIGIYGYKRFHIDWKEYAAALALMCLVFTPAIYFVGDRLSVREQLTYEEFYNGVETAALEHAVDCRDGQRGNSRSSGQSNCTYTYVCGSYSFEEAYTDYEYYTDAEGNQQSRPVTRYRTVWADIECPYLTQEFTYTINDSLPDGEHRLPGTYGDEQPVAWDNGESIPSDIPLGPPEEWTESKERLNQGDPRPVTRIYKYDNFILAAEEDLLLPYVEDIDTYLEAGILPDHTENILTDDTLYGFHGSIANKLSFVGVEPPGDESDWQEALNGLNGALGMTLQGDVHMVIIDADLVTSQVRYVDALKAYWTSEAFGRRAIAKNAIIVAVGVRGDNAVWAEAATGMPFGNEVMLEAISTRFEGNDVPFTHQAIIGDPKLTFAEGEDGEEEPQVVLAERPGIIEEVILQDFPFVRASMGCTDEEDGENCLGFGHLVSKLEPTLGAKIWMGVVLTLISGVLWFFAAKYEWFAWVVHPVDQRARHEHRASERKQYTRL